MKHATQLSVQFPTFFIFKAEDCDFSQSYAPEYVQSDRTNVGPPSPIFPCTSKN